MKARVFYKPETHGWPQLIIEPESEQDQIDLNLFAMWQKRHPEFEWTIGMGSSYEPGTDNTKTLNCSIYLLKGNPKS